MVTMRKIVPLFIASFSAAFVSGGTSDAEAFDSGFCASEEVKVELEGFALVAEEPEPQKATDPYAGWQNWCEPVDYQSACQEHVDCKDAEQNHPAHRPMRCYNPWYAKKNPDYKICAPGYARKSELNWREGRLREVVAQSYFGEVDYCEYDGRPIRKEGYKCHRARRAGDLLTSFLLIPYDRETTRRPWKRHRLDADLRANRTAWFNQADKYGWRILTDKSGETTDFELAQNWGSPYYGERHRWHFGLGPFGQNAALYVRYWDVKAPPEILCREVESVEAYLRNARRIVRNLKNGIRCNGEYYEDKSPTWTVVHRAASSGKICPATEGQGPKAKKRAAKKLASFRAGAKAHGVDPDQVVTLKMLGASIPQETQNVRSAEIYAVLDEKWPVEKMGKKH